MRDSVEEGVYCPRVEWATFFMPHRFEYDSAARVLLLEGEIRGWDISAAAKDLAPYLDELRLAAIIADFTAVTVFDVAGAMIGLQSKRDAALVRDTPLALLVPQTHKFGLARMYELSADPSFSRLQIVRTREEAFASLKLPTLRFESLVFPNPEPQ